MVEVVSSPLGLGQDFKLTKRSVAIFMFFVKLTHNLIDPQTTNFSGFQGFGIWNQNLR